MRLVAVILGLLSLGCQADTLRVAVAANFSHTAQLLASRFEAASGHTVKLSPGSTGKHYGQIVHGAPFDLFLAADSARPARLEQQGRIVPGSRFTYAIGQLALWSPAPDQVDGEGAILTVGRFDHLAIANPRLAPYGLAAQQVLQRLDLWQPLQSRLVRGENIGQTFRFVQSGGAELGFVALSQARQVDTGSLWLPPAALYDPIEQQAVLLHDSPAARAFSAYLQSTEARELIRGHGYATP